jgi:hypothetical protein
MEIPMTDQPKWSATRHGVLRGVTYEHLGYIPTFLSVNDPRPAKEQINTRYAHGGGWNSSKSFDFDLKGLKLLSKHGDPPLEPLAETWLRYEHILYYDSSFVAIVQIDGSYEIARID